MTNYEFDAAIRSGHPVFCGVDEAGRGPLAGPVYAAAVILPPTPKITGVNDSKKLSPQKRDKLFDEICSTAVAWNVASASVEEIESLNILQATFLAMRRAVAGLQVPPNYIVIDGNKIPPQLPVPAECVVKGDSLSASVAAASILAKVSRDRYMQEMDALYPQYLFAKHKGYGTELHVAKLKEYGVCPIHRRSFLTKILGDIR